MRDRPCGPQDPDESASIALHATELVSTEEKVLQVMAPKFTIRQMLLGVIAVAFLSALLASAARGSMLGFGIGIAIISLALVAVIYGIVYLVARVVSVGLEPTGYAPVESTLAPEFKQANQPFGLSRNTDEAVVQPVASSARPAPAIESTGPSQDKGNVPRQKDYRLKATARRDLPAKARKHDVAVLAIPFSIGLHVECRNSIAGSLL